MSVVLGARDLCDINKKLTGRVLDGKVIFRVK
jgi:hypothetical protein